MDIGLIIALQSTPNFVQENNMVMTGIASQNHI